jgi:hypothetical protein
MKHLFTISILLLFTVRVNAQTTGTIVVLNTWGTDLTMRLDTLTGQTSDSIQYNKHTFKIVTDAKYMCSYYPAECRGILVFTDAAGNVQNYAVKSYEFEYYNGNLIRGGCSERRDFGQAARAIERHKTGAYVTVTKVELVDLSGRPVAMRVPPFKIVKTR